MSAPSWLAFIAVAWWAAFFSPAQSHRWLHAALLDGIDLPVAVTTLDQRPSLQTNDRRRSESARDTNPPPSTLAATSIEPAVIASVAGPVFTRTPAAQPARSPAQPRAPPVDSRAR